METKSEQTNNSKSMCCRRPWPLRIMRGIISLVLVFIILIFGVGLGFAAAREQGEHGWNNYRQRAMYMNRYNEPSDEGCTMCGDVIADTENEEETTDSARLFGAITKIEGNKITVMTNAAQEQIVLSQTDTVIALPTDEEIGLAALKAGQNIIVTGTLNDDMTVNAEWITVAK